MNIFTPLFFLIFLLALIPIHCQTNSDDTLNYDPYADDFPPATSKPQSTSSTSATDEFQSYDRNSNLDDSTDEYIPNRMRRNHSDELFNCTFEKPSDVVNKADTNDPLSLLFIAWAEYFKARFYYSVFTASDFNLRDEGYQQFYRSSYWLTVYRTAVLLAFLVSFFVLVFVCGCCTTCFLRKRQRGNPYYICLSAMFLPMLIFMIVFGIYGLVFNHMYSSGLEGAIARVDRTTEDTHEQLMSGLALLNASRIRFPAAQMLLVNAVKTQQKPLTANLTAEMNKTIGIISNATIDYVNHQFDSYIAVLNTTLVQARQIINELKTLKKEVTAATTWTVQGQVYRINFPTLSNEQRILPDQNDAAVLLLLRNSLHSYFNETYTASVVSTIEQTAANYTATEVKSNTNYLQDVIKNIIASVRSQYASVWVSLTDADAQLTESKDDITPFVDYLIALNDTRHLLVLLGIMFYWLAAFTIIFAIVFGFMNSQGGPYLMQIGKMVYMLVIVGLVVVFVLLFAGSLVLSDFCYHASEIAEANMKSNEIEFIRNCEEGKLFAYMLKDFPLVNSGENFLVEYHQLRSNFTLDKIAHPDHHNNEIFKFVMSYISASDREKLDFEKHLHDEINTYLTTLLQQFSKVLPTDAQLNKLAETGLLSGRTLTDVQQQLTTFDLTDQMVVVNNSISEQTFGLQQSRIYESFDRLNSLTLPYNVSYNPDNITAFNVSIYPEDKQQSIFSAYQSVTSLLEYNQTVYDTLAQLIPMMNNILNHSQLIDGMAHNLANTIQTVRTYKLHLATSDIQYQLDHAKVVLSPVNTTITASSLDSEDSFDHVTLVPGENITVTQYIDYSIHHLVAIIDDQEGKAIWDTLDPLVTYQFYLFRNYTTRCEFATKNYCDVVNSLCTLTLPGSDGMVAVFFLLILMLCIFVVLDAIVCLFMPRALRHRSKKDRKRERLFDEPEEAPRAREPVRPSRAYEDQKYYSEKYNYEFKSTPGKSSQREDEDSVTTNPRYAPRSPSPEPKKKKKGLFGGLGKKKDKEKEKEKKSAKKKKERLF